MRGRCADRTGARATHSEFIQCVWSNRSGYKAVKTKVIQHEIAYFIRMAVCVCLCLCACLYGDISSRQFIMHCRMHIICSPSRIEMHAHIHEIAVWISFFVVSDDRHWKLLCLCAFFGKPDGEIKPKIERQRERERDREREEGSGKNCLAQSNERLASGTQRKRPCWLLMVVLWEQRRMKMMITCTDYSDIIDLCCYKIISIHSNYNYSESHSRIDGERERENESERYCIFVQHDG